MEKKIYINYDAHEYYTSYEEAFEYFKEYENAYSLEDYLDNHYSHLETIFNLSEEEKEEAREDYEKELKECFGRWVEEFFEVIDIDIVFK